MVKIKVTMNQDWCEKDNLEKEENKSNYLWRMAVEKRKLQNKITENKITAKENWWKVWFEKVKGVNLNYKNERDACNEVMKGIIVCSVISTVNFMEQILSI
jgi:hypothetical protein